MSPKAYLGWLDWKKIWSSENGLQKIWKLSNRKYISLVEEQNKANQNCRTMSQLLRRPHHRLLLLALFGCNFRESLIYFCDLSQWISLKINLWFSFVSLKNLFAIATHEAASLINLSTLKWPLKKCVLFIIIGLNKVFCSIYPYGIFNILRMHVPAEGTRLVLQGWVGSEEYLKYLKQLTSK